QHGEGPRGGIHPRDGTDVPKLRPQGARRIHVRGEPAPERSPGRSAPPERHDGDPEATAPDAAPHAGDRDRQRRPIPPPVKGRAARAALLLLLATILFTWPFAAHVSDGLGDIWDAKLNAWILHWDFHQTFQDPMRLFDANIFHPARYALAFSENLYGASLFGFPLYAAGVST